MEFLESAGRMTDAGKSGECSKFGAAACGGVADHLITFLADNLGK